GPSRRSRRSAGSWSARSSWCSVSHSWWQDSGGDKRRRPAPSTTRSSPARVDRLPQQIVVGLAHGLVEAGEDLLLLVGGDAARGGVAPGLLAAAGPGDRGGHPVLGEDPAQRRLRQRHLPAQRVLEARDGLQPQLVLD